MMNSFALFPLLSILPLILPFKGKGKRGMLLAIFLSAFSIFLGFRNNFMVAGFLNAVLFIAAGLFQYPLKREVQEAVSNSLQRQLYLQAELSKKQLECEKLESQRKKLQEEAEQISKRYLFAKSLVSYMEEVPILEDLNSIFAFEKNLLSYGFATNPDLEPELDVSKDEKIWKSFFAKGFLDQEGWNKILQLLPLNLNRSEDRIFTPLDRILKTQVDLDGKKTEDLYLVGFPVRWQGRVHGLLFFLLEGSVSDDFLDKVSFAVQLLGLGFHKIHLYRKILERSRRDGLTNLYLRRVFLERLSEEISLTKRYGTSFSLLMLDLDHFKLVNDRYGHVAGDAVLKKIAEILKANVHHGVNVCRYGGEEFALLIGLAPQEVVLATAEHLRSAIENSAIEISEGVTIKITVSIGAAHYLPEAPLAEELIQRADHALYQAKESGRNCVREWKV
ncbi:MAG: diguanylate cyclase [Elusimicrobia bacterium]|nr:diguanylate cyclase [Elusimicrobiota bacterium]